MKDWKEILEDNITAEMKEQIDIYETQIALKQLGKIDDKDMPDADKISKLGDAIKPLGEGIKGFSGVDMAAIVDTSMFGKSSLEVFFDMLSGDKLKVIASKSELEEAGKGITAMGEAVSTFSGIDMGTIVGNNWTPGKETSFESFLKGVGSATEKIKSYKI